MENIRKTFAKYVSSNVLGMLGISCYILADTFFVANGVGPGGLAALNLAIPVYSIVHGAGLMAGIGGATRFSLSKDKNIFTQAVFYVLMMAAFFVSAGFFFSDEIASLLGADCETIENTSVYLKVILCFSPAFLMNNILLCFVRNDGEPKLPMAAMLLGSFLNVVLDYIFIFPCNMGMFGAALATGIAPVVGICTSTVHFIRKRNTFKISRCRVRFKSLRDISMLGLSSFVTEVSSAAVIIVFNMIILKIDGNPGVAAYGIVANIALVIISVFTGISQGMQPIVSRSFALGEKTNVSKVLKYGIFTAVLLSSVIYAASFIFAEGIANIFNSDKDPYLTATAAKGMRIYFASFLLLGINMLLSAYYSAVGKANTGFVISFMRGFAVIIPAALLLSGLLKMTGVWLSAAVSEAAVLLGFLVAKALKRRRAED